MRLWKYEINARSQRTRWSQVLTPNLSYKRYGVPLVAEQQDRTLEVAREYKGERERLDRINEGAKIEELLRQKHAEEQKQNRRWLFKENAETILLGTPDDQPEIGVCSITAAMKRTPG